MTTPLPKDLETLIGKVRAASDDLGKTIADAKAELEAADLSRIRAEGYTELVAENREFAKAVGELQAAVETADQDLIAKEAEWAAEDAAGMAKEAANDNVAPKE